MTNKIDELWGKALDKAVPDTYSSLTWTQVEKIKTVFAELIVEECTKVCSEVEDTYGNLNKIDISVGAGVCVSEIKERFGVEE